MKSLGVMLALVCLMGAGCASTNFDHMATTNWMDRTIVPDNKVGQWAMTPLLVPLCVGTLAVDNFIVAPAVHLASAFADAGDWWNGEVGGYYTEMGVLPIRVALTPVIFLGSWLGRSFFSIEPESDAAWGWPGWGVRWERDEDGRLLGPRGAS